MSEALIATGPAFANPQLADGSVFLTATALANARTFLDQMQIFSIYLLLDSFQLNEGTLSRLNEAAAGSEGLSLMFDTWDWTQTPVNTVGSCEAQVSQARSRIIRSFCVIRDAANRTNPFANSLASEAAINRPFADSKSYSTNPPAVAGQGYQLLVNSYQAQLGSLYFPQQPLQTVEEYVMNAYYTWSRSYADPNETNAMSLSEFIGGNGFNMYTGGNIIAPITESNFNAPPGNLPGDIHDYTSQISTSTAVTGGGTVYGGYYQFPKQAYMDRVAPWAMNWGSANYGFIAERSQLLQLSGLPISNARLLRHRFNLNYVPPSNTSRTIDCYTEYTRVMKVFLGGRIVMRE